MDNKINDLIDKMNLEETKAVLRNVLRKVPDKLDDIVLEIINDTIGGNDPKITLISNEEINLKMDFFYKKFNLITENELYFYCSWEDDYESYDYWNDNGEWRYWDNDGVGTIINDAFDFAVTLVNMKRYADASKIFDLIFYTDYCAYDEDGGDNIELSLKELNDNNLINFNVDNLYLYIIYSNYQANVTENRAKVIYEYLKNKEFKEVKIKEAFKLGLEVVNEEKKFWEDLIVLLSNNEGDREYELLIEAFESNDEEFAKIFELPEIIYKTHPKLFFDYLKDLDENEEYFEIIESGDEILEKIDDNLVVRSEMALVIAKANIFFVNDTDKYLFEIFKSNSNCINLLRIILNKSCFDKYRDEIIKCVNKDYSNVQNKYETPRELWLNCIYKDEYRLLNFFLGNFDDVINCVKNNNNYLGWSNSFVKYSVYLLLLYLYDGDIPTSSINMIASSVFDKINGHDKKLELFDNDIFGVDILSPFFEIFRRWKNKFKMDDDLKEEIMACLKQVIENRVDAIVGNGYRGSYYKAALLVVAYSDILKVHNIEEGNEFVAYYHTRHSRKSAFRKELRELI